MISIIYTPCTIQIPWCQNQGYYSVNICWGARYKDLWALKDKQRKIKKNVHFYVYLDALRDEAMKASRVTDAYAKKYQKIIRLVMGPHEIHI